MKEIGGYFEIELRKEGPFHPEAIALNTGRNAFEYILKLRGYKKVYLPYFTCDTMMEPIRKLEIDHEFYHINEQFEPVFDFSRIGNDQTFVLNNYFGLFDRNVKKVGENCPNLIIDNCQSFFSGPLERIDTFYSARKFFGVPDGAYLYLKGQQTRITDKLETDQSLARIEYLFKRIESGTGAAYEDFKNIQDELSYNPIRKMSDITGSLLKSIDYDHAAKRRRMNFEFLHYELKDTNLLRHELDEKTVPMLYPFMVDNPELRSILIRNKIYIPTYWPNVFEWCSPDSLEYRLAKNVLYLPVDQRYGEKEMNRIIEVITKAEI